MRYFAVLFVASCYSASQPAPYEEPPVPVAPAPGSFAIVTVVERTDECGGGFVMKTLDRKPEQRVLVRGRVQLDDLYVAELLPAGDCNFDSRVDRVVAVPTMPEARRIVSQVRRTGFANTVVLRPYTGPETFGIARVIHVRGRQIQLEPIRGEVPAWLDMPFHDRRNPMLGDRVVIASAHAKPTRIVITNSFEDARRWESSIYAEGWPPDATLIDY